MTRSSSRMGVFVVAAYALAVFASGCPKDDKAGGSTREDGGSSNPAAGSGGSTSVNGAGGSPGAKDAGSHASGSGGASSAARDSGTSNTGVLDAGGSATGGCKVGGCSGELCTDGKDDVASPCIWRDEFACYKDATCARQIDGACGWTLTPALQKCLDDPSGAGGGQLAWYQTCGAPVCQGGDQAFDDPNVPNCTKEQTEGAACDTKDQRCDGVAGCGAMLVCSDSDPKLGPGGCPISRARYKQDIEYLDARQLRDYHAQLTSMPLASYRYKNAPDAPQLGFIVDDIEPSVAVAGDRVNMYGYLSMAVAAIQVQAQQIEALEREVAALSSQIAKPAPAMCEQP